MARMYEKYKDLVEFRIVYVKEAHAADGDAPTEGQTIKLATNREERCQTASRLIENKQLKIPMLVDEIDNRVCSAYQAHPDRLFVIRTDGKFGFVADKGPWGFMPGLVFAERWLAEFKKTGQDPKLPPPGQRKTQRFDGG